MSALQSMISRKRRCVEALAALMPSLTPSATREAVEAKPSRPHLESVLGDILSMGSGRSDTGDHRHHAEKRSRMSIESFRRQFSSHFQRSGSMQKTLTLPAMPATRIEEEEYYFEMPAIRFVDRLKSPERIEVELTVPREVHLAQAQKVLDAVFYGGYRLRRPDHTSNIRSYGIRPKTVKDDAVVEMKKIMATIPRNVGRMEGQGVLDGIFGGGYVLRDLSQELNDGYSFAAALNNHESNGIV
ncbi:hypothetical protein BZA05DRAFT_421301 [Tricharina praecox]|uniref:uncharacterized protein n=1 Tax=Tricharina praecox TaxID=43433 RepID=UPI002220E38E|nr:uncharacterized protein BZA05DRAFT_421301 [Tricharina praecox]KAI5845477.1 hypothetical protein BZA05DRAFT_421301 [Tricharina praecox]